MSYQSQGNGHGKFSLLAGNRAVRRATRRSARYGAPTPTIRERIFDAIPGILVWFSLFVVALGAVYFPWELFSVATAVAVYMAVRIAFAGLANILGLRRIRRWERADWRAEYERRCQPDSLRWEDVRHLVIVPSYREDIRVLRQTLDRLAASPLAREQVIVALAMEARDPGAQETADQLAAEFRDRFCHLIITIHPKNLPGEIPSKSPNIAWAGRHAKYELVEQRGYTLGNIVVTAMDADSVLHPKYLESLTCLFATSPERYRSFWQAPIRYHNNVWEVNPGINLLQAYSSAWELAYLAGWWWEGLPISTYSLSLMLVDAVGYWDPNVIADEAHMFIKCHFRRGGKLALCPIFLPFSGYAVTGDGFLDVCRNRYKQTVRHAWGAKEIGYTLTQMADQPVPLSRALRLLFAVSHDNLMASAGWVLITFGAQLPILLNPQMLSQLWWSPQFLALQVALITVALAGILFWRIDLRLRPPRPRPLTAGEAVLTAVSFLLLPIMMLFLVSIPAIEAHTRMMLGIPLHFQVARKI